MGFALEEEGDRTVALSQCSNHDFLIPRQHCLKSALCAVWLLTSARPHLTPAVWPVTNKGKIRRGGGATVAYTLLRFARQSADRLEYLDSADRIMQRSKAPLQEAVRLWPALSSWGRIGRLVWGVAGADAQSCAQPLPRQAEVLSSGVRLTGEAANRAHAQAA